MIEVKMISKLWLLICATHIVIIKGTYDPALNGIKTRNYHRTYPNAEQEPHINSQSYEPRPISNGNYGAGSVRLSPTNSYPHYDGSRTEQQPSHSHQHQHAVGQQQHQKQTAQQTASYQQRELPLFNRNAHVRHSTPTQRSERRESVLSSGLESTIPDFDTGCPPQHTGPVPYAYDCRRFVNCWHGRGHIQSCGPGTVFNPETLECDRPDKVVCGGALTNGERREQQATLHSAPQQNKYRAGRLIDASTDSVRDLCPNGFSGLAPHPNDCTKFLNCANGNTHVQNCGPGTAFSASKKVCDFKENVDCGDRENSAYGAVNNRDSRQYDEVFCPSGASGLYPHPYDCTRFLNCAHGQMVVQSCGPGTAFDRVKLICDYVKNVDCTTTIKAKSNLNYVDTNVQQNALGRGEEKEEGDIFCPPGVSGHFPYPFDYTKFINCKNGNTAIQNCVPNTAYSISRNYCESKEKVPRTDHVAYIVSEVRYEYSLTIVSCPPSTDGLHLYPYDFTKYISCQQEHMNIVACAPKYVFSISRRECLPETQVNIADRVRNAWELRHNVESTDSHNVHGNNPNANYQPPPTQSNYRDSTQNGWRQQHHEHGSSSQRTANDRQTYGNGVPTTSTQTGSYGDRWSNMDVQRPIASDMTYVGWIASGSAIDRQTPTQSVIYEEGSLQPNRNYNTFSTYTTPLAPFKPESVPATSVNSNTFTNETTNIYYAQPVGSEENTEEVFDDSRINTQSSNRLPFNKNEFNVAQTSNKWISIPNQELLPPKRTPEPQTEAQDFPPQNIFTPASYITPPTGHAHSSTGDSSTFVPQNQFDSSNLYGGLQPPPPPPPAPTIPQSPLSHASNPIHNFEPSNPTKGGPSGRSLDEIEPIRAFSTNAHGKPHLLSPPSSMNAYKTDIDTSTPATYLQPPALPTPAAATATRSYSGASTRLKPVHNVLENTTIAMFPKDPHYSGSYSNVAHASPPKSVDFEDVQASEDLLMADALRLLLRPYFNRSGTISEENADKVEGHIMKLSPKLTSHTSVITSSTDKTIKNSPVGAENEKEVELILAGEQHSLTTVPTQNSTHETRTEFYSKNTRQESKTNSNWHNHGHSREFHRKHPNLLDPFNEDDHTSTHTHHRHNHNRAYHQRHPEIPNPFITPETPQTTTNFELSNNNLPNPHAENTTPFSVRPRIDVRGEDINCQFDCGNGNCVKSHEVCNGINNCGNRKDEEDCKHLGYEVRLTGGESLNMGRIEVKVLGKWGYVCDDKFGLSDAEVVCRELGFKLGASEVRGFSYYPPTTVDVSFAMDEVECRGNETSLKECSFKGWGVSNCGPDEVVGVVCKVPQLKCPNNYWLCSTSQECIPPAFVCDNTPDCADKSDESETVCNSPIKYRLEGGSSPNEGRLEVRYRGEWGTVCDDDFGLKEARVMCNSMGFYGTPTIVKNKYGSGNGPIWLDQVSCYGNETTLDQCGHFTWGEHNCNHTEDVGLKCTLGAPPQKENSSPQLNDFENTQRELDDTQQQLEDIGLYSEQWERKSKAVGDQRRCGQFKNNLLDEFAHPEERVVNGSIAKRGHHPWQATIRTRGRGGISSHWCGAVLISSRHLLTAAHCLAGYPKGAYLVRMGDHYANIAESSEVDSFIENWYIHEKFRDGSHMNNDIAVIVLKTPVRFNDYIQPVCLPNKGAALAENRLCTISGWGSIKSGVSTPSNILRAAELPILSDEVCKQKHVYGASLTEGMFCAGYMDESSDACDGDSGGPLICHDEDGETLYGIISWGQHCGYANKPGVYVRVEKYVDWILEKINISIQNKL
ncbi:uncharacterized protein LOC105232808 isoform X5 [Bactrocera dorsalis]|uniref:Uncharacterized protein LOC105232808 isoform X5 n=1 Tax=Bactrocera dorsalis TaxID=27457 RepID=A0ABM3JVF0_BACDO|nr:uncharacterized protein LOC105232808 isoform X5 [Bactrocera dorsalis]